MNCYIYLYEANMTQEEFNNIKFTFGMIAEYKGKTYYIVTVNFEEHLIGLYDSDIIWARCENCRIINESEVEQKNEK